jgi:hypothetical protein
MQPPDPSARPSQVTVAGWAVAIASALLVLAVFDALGHLETVDMRERLSKAIGSGLAKDSGFTVADATEVLRWCLYVSGVAAAVSGILGVYVLQGHRGARVGVSVAALSIVLTASIAGSLTSFLGMFIAVGSSLLWTRPARDWFAGRPVTVPPKAPKPQQVERRVEPEERRTPVAWAPPAAGSARPAPTPGWGQLSPAGPPVPPASAPRPTQVRLACVLTWVFSSLTALGYAAVLLVLAVDKDRLVEEMMKSPGWQKSFDVDTVTTVAAVAAAVFVIWSLAAIVLAALAWRRVRWAWVLLLVSAWLAGLLSVLAFPFSLPYLAVIGASTGMLMRRPSREWFARSPYQRPRGPMPRPGAW